MNEVMDRLFKGKNWISTVIGLLVAGLLALQQAYSQGHIPPEMACLIFASAALGAFTKIEDSLNLGIVQKLILKHGVADVQKALNDAMKNPSVVKLVILCLLVCFAIFPAAAQTASPAPTAAEYNLPDNLVGAGGNWNSAGSPKFDGLAVYGHLVNNTTYSFSMVDLFPVKGRVETQLTTGLLNQFTIIAGYPVYACGTTGVATSGAATGWAWNLCAATYIPIKKWPNWAVMPIVRLNKSTVGSGYTPILGAVLTWGQ